MDDGLTALELAKAQKALAAMQQAGLQVEQLSGLVATDRALFEMVIEWGEANVRGSVRGCVDAVTGLQIRLDLLNRLQMRQSR